jgi:hypothetical protein
MFWTKTLSNGKCFLTAKLAIFKKSKEKGKKKGSYSEPSSWLIHTSLKNVCLSMKVIIAHHDH